MSEESPASQPVRNAAAARGEIRFREAGPADAAGLLALKRALDLETSFMLLEPGERAESAGDLIGSGPQRAGLWL